MTLERMTQRIVTELTAEAAKILHEWHDEDECRFPDDLLADESGIWSDVLDEAANRIEHRMDTLDHYEDAIDLISIDLWGDGDWDVDWKATVRQLVRMRLRVSKLVEAETR